MFSSKSSNDHSAPVSFIFWPFLMWGVENYCPGALVTPLKITFEGVRGFESHRRRRYEVPYGLRVSKGPEGVVSLTRYRRLRFSSLCLRKRESIPHVIGEGKMRVIRRSSDRLGRGHIGLIKVPSLAPNMPGDGKVLRWDIPGTHCWIIHRYMCNDHSICVSQLVSSTSVWV